MSAIGRKTPMERFDLQVQVAVRALPPNGLAASAPDRYAPCQTLITAPISRDQFVRGRQRTDLSAFQHQLTTKTEPLWEACQETELLVDDVERGPDVGE